MPKVSPLINKLIKDHLRLKKEIGTISGAKDRLVFQENFINYVCLSLRNSVDIEGTINSKKLDSIILLAVKKTFPTFNAKPSKFQIKLLSHPLFKKFFRICKSRKILYLLVEDFIRKDPKKAEVILENPEKVEVEILKRYEDKIKDVHKDLLQKITRSAIALSLSLILFFAVIGNLFSFVSIINITTPLLFILLFTLSAKNPPKKNKKKIVLDTFKIIYKQESRDPFVIKKPLSKKSALYFLISFFYVTAFFLLAGFLIWVLVAQGYPLVNSVVFILSLSYVSFVGIKIKEKVRELYVTKIRETFLDIVMEILALPFLWIEKKKIFFCFLKKKKTPPPSSFTKKITPSFFISNLSNKIKKGKDFLKEKKDGIYEN